MQDNAPHSTAVSDLTTTPALIPAASAMEPVMSDTLMILPASDSKKIRLIRIPDDFEAHEVFRHVTGLIAEVEEDNPHYDWDDIQAMLEDHGFETVDFQLGPALD